MKSEAAIAEEERLAAETAEKLRWLDEVWALEEETEREIAEAEEAEDADAEEARRQTHAAASRPGSAAGRVSQAGAAPEKRSRVRSQTDAAVRMDSRVARGQATATLALVRELEGRIRGAKDGMDATERLIKELQSQVDTLENESLRKQSVAAYSQGAGAGTRGKWANASLEEAYAKLEEAMGRLQALQEAHYADIVTRNAAEVELVQLEADIADDEREEASLAPAVAATQGLTGTLALADPGASTVKKELLRAENRVRAFRSRQQAAAELYRKAEREAQAARRRAVQMARDGRLKAILRIREKMAQLREQEGPVRELRDDLKEGRIEALMQLKKSLDQAHTEVVRRNEMRERFLRDKQHRMMEEKEAMLEAGVNPYQVFRQRDIDGRVAKRQQALERKIKRAEREIMERLIREDEMYNRELAARRVEEEYQRKFQDEMGVAAKERKLRRWMMRHNRTGKELLDPTGRIPVNPSEVSVVKPPGFGLGKADQFSLDLIRDRFGRNVPLVDTLLPKRLQDAKEVENLPDDPTALGGTGRRKSQSDPVPSKDGKEATAPGGDLLGKTLAQPEFPPLWEEADEGDTRVLYRPKLTKAEAEKLERLRKEHREFVSTGGRKAGEVTMVMGREFKGDGFLMTPKEVVFKDFEVGETYRQKITLTNVFWTKNTFKVMEMPPEVRNFFEVEYKFPGLVSAGIACDIFVHFEPKVNEDIVTHIPIITQTGPITVPVRCTRRRATLSLSTSAVNFSGITIGETKEQRVEIVNNGALGVDFKIEVADAKSGMKDPPEEQKSLIDARDTDTEDWNMERLFRENVHAARLKDLGLRVSDWKGHVKPYSKTQFSVSFQPPGIGPCSARLRVVFTSKDNVKEYIPEVEFRVAGDAADLPVVCEDLVLDMQCMIRGQAYTQQLVLVNRSSVSCKCFLQRNPVISKYLEVYPRVGYVQAHDTFALSLKLKPTPEMLEEIRPFARVTRNGDDGDFEIPLRVAVPDQALPATFTLKGSLTTSDVLIEPKSLDFGQIGLGEATGLHLKLTNLARLPQKFGFCNLRKGLQVQPNDGFGTLLPGQSSQLVVSYTPDISGTHKFPLDLRTLLGRHMQIPCRAVVTSLPVVIDRNRITMPCTEVGRSSVTSVELRNQSPSSAFTFQFAVPTSSRVKVSPNVGKLAPGAIARLEVVYTPLESDFEELRGKQPQRPARSAAVPPDGAGGEAEGETEKENAQSGVPAGGGSGEGPASPGSPAKQPPRQSRVGIASRGEWATSGSVTIPCYLREEEASRGAQPEHSKRSLAARENQGLDEGAKELGKEAMPIHLQVVTSAKLPELVADGLEWRPESGCYQLSFGEVALGERVLKTLTVCNNGPRATTPRVGALHHTETFHVVNRSRLLGPGDEHGFLLAYNPERAGKHREVLQLTSEHSTVRVALVGTGISPSFEVDRDALDLGDVYKGETKSESFTIENTSPFPLKYKLQLKEGAHTNIGGTPVFVVKPSEGTIPSKGESSDGTQQVEVTFLPDHEYLYFENVLSILVPNQEEDVTVKLQGRSWDKGMYLVGGDKVTTVEDPFKSKQLAKFESLTPAIPVVLTFPDEVYPGEVSEGELEVGNLAAAAGKEKGEFTVPELSHAIKEAGWSVEPMKGVVDPGSRQKLVFSFRCPDDPGRLNLAYLDMGGWIEASIDVSLRGGFPAPKDKDQGTIYRVRARCYIKPAKKKKASKKGLRFRG